MIDPKASAAIDYIRTLQPHNVISVLFVRPIVTELLRLAELESRLTELRDTITTLRLHAEQCGRGEYPFHADSWPASAAYEHASDMVEKWWRKEVGLE